MSLRKLVVSILLAFVGLMFVIYVTPEIESQVSSANISNTFVSAMVDMGEWLIPIGGIIGVFYGVFRLFEGQRGSVAVGTAFMPISIISVFVGFAVAHVNRISRWLAKVKSKVP